MQKIVESQLGVKTFLFDLLYMWCLSPKNHFNSGQDPFQCGGSV